MPEATATRAATRAIVATYQRRTDAIRRDIHADPELSIDTHRTADIFSWLLKSWGIEVHRLVDVGGVISILRSGNGPHSIGLRHDIRVELAHS